MLPPNFIIIWPSTNASIPSGWTRETTLDDKYPKATASATNPNVTGGNATHTHTSPAHAHTAVAHRHYGNTTRDGTYESDGGSQPAGRDAHIHAYDATTVTNGNLSDAVTYGSIANDPPFITTIFIKSANYRGIPASAVVLWNTTYAPTGYDYCDGASGRPDYRNRYLKGASTGADAGTTGGTLNHEHSINHTHSAVTHTHSFTTDWDSDQDPRTRNTTAGGGSATDHHTHTLSLSANSAETASAYSGNAGSADTVEPAFKQIGAVQNTSGVTKNPVSGIVGLWLGTLASIPQGIYLCDGNNGTPDMRDKFLKIINTTVGLGRTGGSNTHSHTASNSHNHTIASTHTHTGSTDTLSDPNSSTGAGGNGACQSGHSHTVDTISSATSSWGSATTSANTTSGEASQPEFRTVAYVMFKYFASGLLATML